MKKFFLIIAMLPCFLRAMQEVEDVWYNEETHEIHAQIERSYSSGVDEGFTVVKDLNTGEYSYHGWDAYSIFDSDSLDLADDDYISVRLLLRKLVLKKEQELQG